VFSVRYELNCYMHNVVSLKASTRLDAGSNTYRSPPSHRRRRKGNPVSEGVTVPRGYRYEDLALQVGGVSNMRH
jgi:hypothetical protein